jgi:uncharacterized membrane protein (UPF0127 family)
MRISFSIVALLFALAGCGSSAKSPLGLPVTPMQIGSRTYNLEIAADFSTREHGLMERDSMESDHGMIFVFPQANVLNFWMKNTRFPLDIIYADDQARVLTIDSMKPYDELTPHKSNGPAKYAIELNVGEIATSGVKIGDKLSIPPMVSGTNAK